MFANHFAVITRFNDLGLSRPGIEHLAPPPPTEYGTHPQFPTQVLRTSSTEKILKSQFSIYSVE